MFRRGGFWVLVRRVAKYEVQGKDGPTVLGVSENLCKLTRWAT
jgi:hypothetical protein